MTYQRPTPVNKNAWTGRAGANPYQRTHKPRAGHPANEAHNSVPAVPPHGIKPL